ncbi:MAG: hypothetical protein AMS27_08915 [Bacteroides sp. SM23_62_1]|nr:MAG: hypothetical protein AMS27_08915 [Bacteroides sp. SM23_62_1]
MNNHDKYSKVIEALKSNKPVLSGKEKLTDDIMRRIKVSEEKPVFQEKLGNYLFGWADHGWIRGAMAAAAALFIGIFITQQIIITNRINNLENQLIRTVNTINGRKPDLGIMHKVFLNMVARDQIKEDSITISTSDLEELLNSYLELQENYEDLQKSFGLEPYIQDMIKRSMEDNTNDNKSKLNL